MKKPLITPGTSPFRYEFEEHRNLDSLWQSKDLINATSFFAKPMLHAIERHKEIEALCCGE